MVFVRVRMMWPVVPFLVMWIFVGLVVLVVVWPYLFSVWGVAWRVVFWLSSWARVWRIIVGL